jgi:uncharacterized protein YndB with AHSA1/START domain
MKTSQKERHGIITEAGTVVFERILPGPIDRIWEYLTDSEKRGRWLASGPMDELVGGRVELFFKNGDLSPVKEPTPERYKALERGVTLMCEVTACKKPHLLSFLWGSDGSEVTFELEPKGRDVLLTLTHRRLPDRSTALNVAGGWHTHLGILIDRLSGESTRPFWSNFLGAYKEYESRIPR